MIDEIKDKILNATGLPTEYRERLKISFEELELNEAGDPADGAIVNCRLMPRIGWRRRTAIRQREDIDEAQMEGPEMLVYALLNGIGMDKRIPIELSAHASVENLKGKIANQAALSHGQKKRLKMSFYGIELTDANELLSDIGIGAEAMIDCHIEAMRGPPRTMIPHQSRCNCGTKEEKTSDSRQSTRMYNWLFIVLHSAWSLYKQCRLCRVCTKFSVWHPTTGPVSAQRGIAVCLDSV